jgi:putative DNA primase/helicase
VGDVLIASGFDGAADTIVPRLVEHGADLRRVHFLQGFARADAYAGPNDAGPSGTGAHLLLTPGGVPLVERALRRLPEVKLVVFDPVSAFLDGAGTRARHVLSALQALAERCGAAFVLGSF